MYHVHVYTHALYIHIRICMCVYIYIFVCVCRVSTAQLKTTKYDKGGNKNLHPLMLPKILFKVFLL